MFKLVQYRNHVKTISAKMTLPERLRGGNIENMVNYVKNVCFDYKSVYLDTKQDVRDRPLKAFLVGLGLLFSGYSIKHNPNYDSFESQLVDYNNQLSRVPSPILNDVSSEHISTVFMLHNQRVLRLQSFGLFSILYRDDHSFGADVYFAQCDYLKPTWKSYFTSRIVDIGFLDTFWIMRHKMKDYDIRQEEWTSKWFLC